MSRNRQGGRQLQSIPAPNQTVLQKFLPGHAEIGRDANDFLFRENRAVPPAAVSALAAVVSGKQFPMERQKLLIQLVWIRMNFEEGSEAQIFVLLLCGGRNIFGSNHIF